MTINLFLRTFPYVLLRGVVYLAFGLALLVFLGIMGGVGFFVLTLFHGAGVALLVVGLIAVGGVFALTALAQRYVLYLVKAAHVAVITEIMINGDLPAGTGQVSYGIGVVKEHFTSASALFAVDQVVGAAVREILRWLTAMTEFLDFIPGMHIILGVVRRILSLAGNYIDEAVMSYIISHREADVWQAACDGVVLYAQSWRRLLVTATLLVLFLGVGWVIGFLIFLFPLLALASVLTRDPALQVLYGFGGLLGAAILANVVKWIVVDPLATVAMVVAYNQAIVGETPSWDLRGRLAQVSGKFRQMLGKANPGPATQPSA